jgi:hypothetical protein
MLTVRARLLALLTLLSFAAFVLTPLPLPAAAAAPAAATMNSDCDHHGSKAAMTGCADIRCLIAVALPAPAALTATTFAWQDVRYWSTSADRCGVTIRPDPSPPRPT